jgi:hypothetical protein
MQRQHHLLTFIIVMNFRNIIIISFKRLVTEHFSDIRILISWVICNLLHVMFYSEKSIPAKQIKVQSSYPILISTSPTCVHMSFFKFSNRWPFLTFSNQHLMTSLTYALTLTHKSAINLRIWKRCRFNNTRKTSHLRLWFFNFKMLFSETYNIVIRWPHIITLNKLT